MSADEIREFICMNFLGGDTDFPIDAETKLLEEGICDSLGLVQIASEIESRVGGISIADQEITRENFDSIGRILAFIEEKKAASA